MDLLVSYDCGRYGRARREILNVLRRLGDERAQVERSAVDGIALAHSTLDAREVVRDCHDLAEQGHAFEFAIKWVPVEYWCDTDLDTIRRLLVDKVRNRVADTETWGMQVAKHRWEKYHSRDIITSLAPAIDRKVDLGNPDKLVRVDILGAKTAVSVLRPEEIFAARRRPPPSPRAETQVVPETKRLETPSEPPRPPS